MKLFFPIGWNPYTPYSSVLYLTGYLNAKGIPSENIDLNILFFNFLLEKEINNSQSKKSLLRKINFLKSKESLLDLNKYLKYKQEINYILSKYSFKSNFINIDISIDGLNFNSTIHNKKVNLDEIYVFIEEISSNTVIHEFYDYLIKEGKLDFNNKDSIIGFSISTFSQLITSLILCKIIKSINKNTQIVLGGNYLTRISKYLSEDIRIFKYIDYLSIHEGEESLLELNNYIINKNIIDITDISNIIYQDKISKKIITNKFSDFDIETPYITISNEIINRKYINIDSIIPIYLTRGCDWKKCTFCSIPDNELHYKVCNIDSVINNIEYLNKKYNIKYFTFIDESLPPGILKKLSAKLIEKNLNIEWACLSRFYDSLNKELLELMYNSGCRRIQFGLESYNDRILNLMNKGIQTHTIDKIIKNCLEVGIALNLFTILGFPSETISEMNSTINYALNIVKLSLTNYKIISSVDFSKFQLCKDSPIYKNPISFGINVIENENKLDLIADYSNKNNAVDNILFDAERKFSNIIYEYFQIDFKDQSIYFDEHYLFLKNCKVTKVNKQSQNIEDIYFKNNKLLNFPTKESNKYYIIKYISEKFIPNGYYNEKELNKIIKTIYSDYALIRRYLVDYKFINRTKDCTLYWKNTKENGDL